MSQESLIVLGIYSFSNIGNDRKTRKTEMGRKTTVWIFQTINLRECTLEEIVVAKKGKSKERN